MFTNAYDSCFFFEESIKHPCAVVLCWNEVVLLRSKILPQTGLELAPPAKREGIFYTNALPATFDAKEHSHPVRSQQNIVTTAYNLSSSY